jgi:hypothetical protein
VGIPGLVVGHSIRVVVLGVRLKAVTALYRAVGTTRGTVVETKAVVSQFVCLQPILEIVSFPICTSVPQVAYLQILTKICVYFLFPSVSPFCQFNVCVKHVTQPEECLKLVQDFFLPHPFLFIIYLSPYHSTLYVRDVQLYRLREPHFDRQQSVRAMYSKPKLIK